MMKKKGLMSVVLAAAVASTAVAGGGIVALAESDTESTNLYPAAGFDEMLLEGEESYTLSETQRCSTGSLGIDSPAVAKKETNGNVYLELKYDGSKGFASFFTMMRIETPGDYKVSVDFKKGENWDTTDNIGFRFFSSTGYVDSAPWAEAVNSDTSGDWFTLTQTYSVSAASQPGVDSFSFWFNTMSNPDNVLMVDNIEIEYIVPEADAPEVIGEPSAIWNEESPADVVFGVDLKGQELLSVTDKDTEEEFSEGFTYSAEDQKITFTSDFVENLGEGAHTLLLTTETGSVELVITVYYATAQIPSSTDGYELVPTMKGGDFESYEIGLEFSDAQTDEAWGSLANYDDPGTIVDDGTGNHVLRLGRKQGSTKVYSSAFCMTSPEIELDDIVTLRYSYKIIGDTSALDPTNVTSSFIGASNVDYHNVRYLNKAPKTYEGNENVSSWDIKYTDGENGYTNVEVSFIVDFAFLNATNSLRFLYQIVDGTEIYIDNVELIRWVEEGSEDAEVPVASGTGLAFDYNDQKDVTLTVDLKDYNISSITLGDETVSRSNYSLSENDTKLTISKDYLATLENGTHTFTLTTLGGSCTFEITVSNHAAQTPADNGGNGLTPGAIAGIVIAAVVVVAAAVAIPVIVKKNKKNKNGKTQD